MCGIAGYLNVHSDETRSRQIVLRMNQLQGHRGPDDEGVYVRWPIALGHRRLSVLDLSAAARQPLANEDQTLWLTYNGEIYNFLEVRSGLLARGHRFRSRTDAEVLLHLYEEVEDDCLQRVEGMFAFALWDEKRQRLMVARDRMGEKPLHYFVFPGGLAFASELKALSAVPEFRGELSVQSLSRYLAFEYVPAPDTIYQGVHKLLPAHYLIHENGQLAAHEYWRVHYLAHRPAREETYAERLWELLSRAVRQRLVSDVPLGVFLSGGVDSSAIVAAVAGARSAHIQTFHIGFNEPGFDESPHSTQVARWFSTDHHTAILDSLTARGLLPRLFASLDEPFGDYSFIPTFWLCGLARRRVTVALSGDGGDELFAGYVTYQAHAIAHWYERLPALVRERMIRRLLDRLPASHAYLSVDFRLKKFAEAISFPNPQRHYRWLGSFSPEEQRSLLHPDVASAVDGGSLFDLVDEEEARSGAEGWLERLLALERRFFLQDYMLVKADRASMAHALEVRNPFLDSELVEFAANLPATMKLHGLTTKYVLRKALAGRMPPEILRRRKQGFAVPIAQWMAGAWKDLVAAMLDPEKLAREGFFNPAYVSRLLTEHLARQANHYKKLWTLVMFEGWLASRDDEHAPSAPGADNPVGARCASSSS